MYARVYCLEDFIGESFEACARSQVIICYHVWLIFPFNTFYKKDKKSNIN